jgi:hypothetical protein
MRILRWLAVIGLVLFEGTGVVLLAQGLCLWLRALPARSRLMARARAHI